MGRPSQTKPARTGANRRDFFKRSSSAAVALAAAPALLPLSASAAQPKGEFRHGVASGDPLPDRVILWTRITPLQFDDTLSVGLVIARDAALADVVYSGKTTTDVSRDFTVKVDADGLQPDTSYYYQFSYKKALSPIGRTKTLPVGPTERLRAAVVSCSNFAAGYFNAYRCIAERADLDMVIHLGDYLYEYGTGQYGTLRPCEPAHEIVTLADYRARHAQYKGDADSQAMHRQHPLVAIWDDHEIANDSYMQGAENHTPETEGAWNDRVAAGLQAYYEWMPVRVVDKKNLRRNNRSLPYGDLADLFMLEERLNGRSKQLPPTVPTELGLLFTQSGEFLDPARSLLGSEEEAWLIKRLHHSKARWKILGQGVMFAQLKAVGAPNAFGGGAFLNPDQWDGYQPARDRIYAALKGADGRKRIDNTVVLTGDIHSSWAADLTQDPNNPDPASGGYNPANGQGSLAVEFVGTSVTSPGLDDPLGETAAALKAQNPHFKYIDFNKRGYMLLDVDPRRVVCEWWHLNTVAAVDAAQTLAVAYQVDAGTNRLVPATATAAKARAAKLAP